MSIAFITHPVFAEHKTGRGHPEQPARVSVIDAAVKKFPFKPKLKFYQPPLATREQLLSVHDESYIDWITSIAPKTGSIQVDADTIMSPHTLEASERAAGAVVYAVDLVMKKEAKVAFCNVRPPGHHAEHQQAMGFCFFNNVAVGAMHAIEAYALKRIAIIDFDAHHGNGTQNIFQKNPHVLYCSSFQHPFYPGYEDQVDNKHILNIPLEAGTEGQLFREKVETMWLDKIAAFEPELIFFSAGFDSHRDDPLANLNLTVDDYVWLTQQIVKIAKDTANGRMVSVLEGGYNLKVLAECVPAHINAMLEEKK